MQPNLESRHQLYLEKTLPSFFSNMSLAFLSNTCSTLSWFIIICLYMSSVDCKPFDDKTSSGSFSIMPIEIWLQRLKHLLPSLWRNSGNKESQQRSQDFLGKESLRSVLLTCKWCQVPGIGWWEKWWWAACLAPEMAWHMEPLLQRWCRLQSSALFLRKWKRMGKVWNTVMPKQGQCYENLLKLLQFLVDEGDLGGNVFCFFFFLTVSLLTSQPRVICPELAQGLLRQSVQATSVNFLHETSWHWENRCAGPWALTYLSNTCTYQGKSLRNSNGELSMPHRCFPKPHHQVH